MSLKRCSASASLFTSGWNLRASWRYDDLIVFLSAVREAVQGAVHTVRRVGACEQQQLEQGLGQACCCRLPAAAAAACSGVAGHNAAARGRLKKRGGAWLDGEHKHFPRHQLRCLPLGGQAKDGRRATATDEGNRCSSPASRGTPRIW